MSKIRLTIGRLILTGTLGVVFFFLIGNIIGISKLNKSISDIEYINKEIDQSLDILLEFKNIVPMNRMYTTNWVFIQNSTDDKNELIKIREEKWIALNEKIQKNKVLFNEYSDLIDSLANDFINLLAEAEDPVINGLKSFDDYNDPFAMMMASEFVEEVLSPKSMSLNKAITEVYEKKLAKSIELKEGMIDGFNNLTTILILISIVALSFGIIVAKVLNDLISRPVVKLVNVIEVLRKGEIPTVDDYDKDNEIGDMFKSIRQLVTGIKSYTFFATKVGEGDFSAQFEKLGENDILGTSLLGMRDNLVKFSDEEKKRNWASEGLAKFATILRQEDNLTELTKTVVSNLVKYVNANQAGFFVTEQNNGNETMELKATYAYNRHKFLDKKIVKNQGLIGQCWFERKYIYITEVPDGYINITSGLGEATPRSILIVPLIYNDQILGIIEIASFNKFSAFEIDFILKLSENIAATISTAKVNESTSKLLNETNEMAEQLRAQEEELRQQTEELMATQEESDHKMEILEQNYQRLLKENEELRNKLNS